jgi:DNA-binding NtrC family response regulator
LEDRVKIRAAEAALEGIQGRESVAVPDNYATVLLVDDEEPIREFGREMLAYYGYDALTADSGEGAIELFQRERHRIGAVILDLNMPGMGGFTCLRQLLNIDPETRVVITSGYSTSSDIRKTLEAGASRFVAKPFKFEDLIGNLKDIIPSSPSNFPEF